MIKAIVGFLVIFGITLFVRIVAVDAQAISHSINPNPTINVGPKIMILTSGESITGIKGN